MIKLGSNNIGKVFLGSNAIGKAYLGSNLVFQAGGTPTYTPLQYIENPLNSDAYINTKILTSTILGYDIDFMSYDDLNSTTYGCILGGRTTSNTDDFQLSTWTGGSMTAGLLRLGTAQQNYTAHLPAKNTRVNVKLTGTSYMVDSAEYTVSRPAYLTGYELYLLALNQQNSASQNGHGRIYSLKIYSGNTLVRDYVPVLRDSDNQAGLYDSVTNKFYGSASSTPFVAGPTA